MINLAYLELGCLVGGGLGGGWVVVLVMRVGWCLGGESWLVALWVVVM